jgi:hypothetical protein
MDLGPERYMKVSEAQERILREMEVKICERGAILHCMQGDDLCLGERRPLTAAQQARFNVLQQEITNLREQVYSLLPRA